MNIDPRVGLWVNFLFLVLSGIAAGAVDLNALPAAQVAEVKIGAEWGVFLITSANMVFHFFSAPTPGPGASS